MNLGRLLEGYCQRIRVSARTTWSQIPDPTSYTHLLVDVAPLVVYWRSHHIIGQMTAACVLRIRVTPAVCV